MYPQSTETAVRESAGSGFDSRLVCFGGSAALQCSLTSSARLNHRWSALRRRAVLISPQPSQPAATETKLGSTSTPVLRHAGARRQHSVALPPITERLFGVIGSAVDTVSE
jgi:hypothetical protein